jgi:hypothetical protein
VISFLKRSVPQTLGRRERPQVLIIDGQPSVLYNGVVRKSGLSTISSSHTNGPDGFAKRRPDCHSEDSNKWRCFRSQVDGDAWAAHDVAHTHTLAQRIATK